MPQQKPKTFNNALSRRIISTPGPAAKNTFFYMQETGCLKTEDAAVTHRQDLESFAANRTTMQAQNLIRGSLCGFISTEALPSSTMIILCRSPRMFSDRRFLTE